MKKNNFSNLVLKNINEHKRVINSINTLQLKSINNFCKIIVNSIKNGGTIYWCGNGGSASDSQHLAAELIGRYKSNRNPIKSSSLNSDTSVITCISNDFGYEKVYSRQLEALAKINDVLVVISTSGNSKNIIEVIKAAKKKKIIVLGLLGKSGGKCKKMLSNKIIVNSNSTARIQEMHITIGHIICDAVEENYGIRKKRK